MVPIDLLSLFSWHELEDRICGTIEVDIALLKRNTKYDGYDAFHPAVVLFWEVLESFSHAERRALLKFAWGRTRLEAGEMVFSQKFTLARVTGSASLLPLARTCFFILDWPDNFPDFETARAKLLYAINECVSIDRDRLLGDDLTFRW